MSNIAITNNDLGDVALGDEVFADETLTLAAADTVAAGTILARDSVSKKLVLYVKGGSTNENGIPKAVLPYEVVTTAGADVPVRAIVGGRVKRERLIIDADGDGSNLDTVETEGLRTYGIYAESVQQLGGIDNPQS